MKKIIRIIAITIGAIFILLITLPILFKSRIEALVKTEINKQVEATVDWEKFSLTFFRGFPDLSINLHELSVIGLEPFEGDTIVSLNRFELRVSPFSALKDNVVVKSILLDRPYINGVIMDDGTANFDIAPEPEPKPEGGNKEQKEKKENPEPEGDEVIEDGESGLGISLELFAIRNARIVYDDRPGDLSAQIDDLTLEVRGDFGMENTDMELLLAIDGITAKSGGIRYMKNGNLDVEIEAAADMVNNLYTLKKNEIRLNGLVLGAEGTVEMPDDGSIITDVRFFTTETSFQTLLSMVPAIYLADFESLETSGKLELNGTVKGILKDSILPNATLNLSVSDGFFSYPDLPKDVSDVQINLAVSYVGSDMDATTVTLNKFHLLLGGNPFDISLEVDHPFSDMHVAGMVKGMIDFSTLKDVVPLEGTELSGRLDTDLSWDTKMSYIENEQFEDVELDGRLTIENLLVEAPDIPVPVQLQKMAMFFNPRFVDLQTLDLQLGSSDLHLDGELTNFIPYVFEGSTVSGSLNVTSTLLDANELIAAEEEPVENPVPGDNAEQEEKPEKPAEAVSDSIAQPAQVKIPENIDFILTLDMKKLLYDNIVVENLAGKMVVQNGIAEMENLSMNTLEGSVNVTGTVDTKKELTEADLELKLNGIDIPSSYDAFVAIEKLAPIAQHCKGKANVEMDLFTQLDAAFEPVYESIDADGHLFARNLKVEQPASLEKLSAALKNEKLKNLELEKADIWFAVRDGRVIVEPFDMNFEESKITASGSHGIDQTMDYLLDMDIAKSDLGAGANELMNSMSALAAGAGFNVPTSDRINVKANITGTFKDPRVSTDLSGNIKGAKETVKEEVRERVTEEVEKVEEQVREEAGQKADELIKAAEEEKAKLVERAEAAGEELKKEAAARGEKLVEEAGSNPFKKIAAQKAAEELNKQAEKQAEKLILEAEEKGDALIAKARDEAGRI